jgi:hypothetical protein
MTDITVHPNTHDFVKTSRLERSEPERKDIMSRTVATYTIHLCKNGVEFQSLPNVAEVGPRPGAGETIDGKWMVRGVTKHTPSEYFVDVDNVSA